MWLGGVSGGCMDLLGAFVFTYAKKLFYILAMRQFLFISIALILALTFQSNANAGEWCYEKDIIYPNGMFGQFSDKLKSSSREVNKIFKDGKDKLPQRPQKMLFGLAYLEVLVNELCFERHNPDITRSRQEVEEIVIDLRISLGLPKNMSRQKMMNIYWSTGRLLSLANAENLNLDEERKQNIATLREAKAALKTALKDAGDDAK